MTVNDTRVYVASKITHHKYKGWHWDYKTKKFYRWNDLTNA